jgi:anaerobic C4-dicarboxylate transporter
MPQGEVSRTRRNDVANEDHNCEAEIATLRGEMMTHIATLTGQVGIALTSVANFKDFKDNDFPELKASVEAFHTESRTREDQKAKDTLVHDKRMKVRLAIASILAVLIIGGGTIAEMRHEDQSRADMQQAIQKTIEKVTKK